MENNLEANRKNLQEKIYELKSEKLKITNQLILFQKDIDNNNAEIEVLENFTKFIESGSSKKDYRRKGDMYAHQIQMEHIKREKDLQNLKIENMEKSKNKQKIIPKLEEIKIKLDEIKDEYNLIKNRLLLHYHKILIEGRDTRQEGLIWIIKAIWNLGHNVTMYYIPSYLDEKSIDFIFSTAHKEFSLQKIKNDIEDIRFKLRNRLALLKSNKEKNNNNKNTLMNSTFKTETKVYYIILFYFIYFVLLFSIIFSYLFLNRLKKKKNLQK
jgi:hypothetical protein